MTGRADYEERKQNRIDRLNYSANKASTESSAAFTHSYNLVKDIPFGQPNINGSLTGVMNKSHNALKKAICLDDKADYYSHRANAAATNNAISSDDPEAINKLQAKLICLEAQREAIKKQNKELKKAGKNINPSYILANLSGTVKATKDRIARLEALESMPEETLQFAGGEIVSNAEVNRIQIFFDEKPNDETIKTLKSYGFKWSPYNQAWQRLRNKYALYIAKDIVNIN